MPDKVIILIKTNKMSEPVMCPDLGGACTYEYTDCPLEQQPSSCEKLPPGEPEDPETPPPGGPGV